MSLKSIAQNRSLARRAFQCLRAPALSPTCTKMKVVTLKQSEGAHLAAYSLVCTVEAHDLTAYSSSSSSSSADSVVSLMEIELTDELYLWKWVAQEGDILQVGDPIAILDEEEPIVADMAELDANQAESDCLWQAYVANKDQDGTCGTC